MTQHELPASEGTHMPTQQAEAPAHGNKQMLLLSLGYMIEEPQTAQEDESSDETTTA